MKIDSDLYRSKATKINDNYDMMRITIDINRIDGIKLKKAIINMIDGETCMNCGSNRFIEDTCELCGHNKEII